MKKRFSLFITLAITTFLSSGCSITDIFSKKEQSNTDQKEDQHTDDQGKQEQTNFNVSFNANGGEGTMSDRKTNGSMFTLPYCEFTYANHTFYEWAVNSPDGLTYREKSTIHKVTSDLVFYATWIEDEIPETNYTVTFDANGGTGTMAAQETNGSTYFAPSCSFTYANHSFAGWTLNSKYGTHYDAGELIENINDDITLYAYWQEETDPATNYTVTFNANGGEGTMNNQQTNGSSFLVPNCSFSKENYEFKSWAYQSKNGVEFKPGETIKNIQNNFTLYALWSEKQPDIPDDPNIPAGYYSQCEGLTGTSLQAKIKSINPVKSPSYDWSRYEDADEAEDDSNSILCVYTRHNIPKNGHCGSYSWNTWNREHVWTQSAYPASDKDNHNIFACEGLINNYRGNLPYDEGGTVVSVHGHTTECKMVSGVSFEPCDAAKGEIARSVMYGTVMYSYTMTQEIKSIELALKWHLEHPISTRDVKRNNKVYENQGNRNPFVDHPEYACKIWGTTNSATRALCGM